jgi:hypothetical protein
VYSIGVPTLTSTAGVRSGHPSRAYQSIAIPLVFLLSFARTCTYTGREGGGDEED